MSGTWARVADKVQKKIKAVTLPLDLQNNKKKLREFHPSSIILKIWSRSHIEENFVLQMVPYTLINIYYIVENPNPDSKFTFL